MLFQKEFQSVEDALSTIKMLLKNEVQFSVISRDGFIILCFMAQTANLEPSA